MKFLILINFFIFLSCTVSLSQNLAPNPSFETYISPDFNGNSGSWKKCVFSDTPDYFPDSIAAKLFKNYYGGNTPHSGHAYIGLFVYRQRPGQKKEIREFVQAALLQPLKKDSFYSVEIYVSPDEESNVFIDGFGIFFSPELIACKKAEEMHDYKPQIFQPRKNLISDKEGWTKISGSFKATGKEKYIVLGNFYSDASTLVKKAEMNLEGKKKKKWFLREVEEIAYFYVDDIKVIYSDSLTKAAEKKKQLARINDSLNIVTQKQMQVKIKKDSSALADSMAKKFPAFTTVKKGQSITLKSVLFEFDKAEFLAQSIEELNELLRFMRSHPIAEIEIRGHTDNLGSEDHNLDLSIARAKAVANFLIKNDINKNRLQFFGYGDSRPIESNETEAGRSKNRRVEIIIVKE